MTIDQSDFVPSCPICREGVGQKSILLNRLIGSKSRIFTNPSVTEVLFVPDRTPLCRNHFLICPRAHVFSISEAIRSTQSNVLGAINFVRRLPGLNEGILVFEHGMMQEDPFGVCIDHAHLHVCSVTEVQARAFMVSATRLGPTFVTQELGDVSEWAPATVKMLGTQRGEYAAFSFAVSGSVYAAVAEVDRLPSRFFRQVAAHAWQLDGSEEEDSVRGHRILAMKQALIDVSNEESMAA